MFNQYDSTNLEVVATPTELLTIITGVTGNQAPKSHCMHSSPLLVDHHINNRNCLIDHQLIKRGLP